jgi:hypothetical protein
MTNRPYVAIMSASNSLPSGLMGIFVGNGAWPVVSLNLYGGLKSALPCLWASMNDGVTLSDEILRHAWLPGGRDEN